MINKNCIYLQAPPAKKREHANDNTAENGSRSKRPRTERENN